MFIALKWNKGSERLTQKGVQRSNGIFLRNQPNICQEGRIKTIKFLFQCIQTPGCTAMLSTILETGEKY
jgi:hypothetical protein